MYPRNVSHSIVSRQHNLNYVFKENSQQFIFYSRMLKENISNLKNLKDLNKKLKHFIKNINFYKIFITREAGKCHRNDVLKVWAHHCECVVAQRLRRYHQMFSLYTKLWEEQALKEFIRKMRQSLVKKGKEFALGAVGVSAYNWEQTRIPTDELKKHVKEFEYIEVLKENTICLACDPTKRTNINTNICKCGTTGQPTTRTYDEWTTFIEKKDLVVWRRLHSSGQYEYKVFGSYNDVSAEDFFNCQVDTDYRRKWDTTAVALEIGETDPSPSSNSDIIYWEMLWPRLFVNRDYVFVRRYLIDNEANTMYVMSKSAEHPKFPKYPDKYRIEDYWSCMVIRPYSDMTQPGLEFSLTYYDNPGVNIPSSVTTWVAMRAMPDFLERLREATKKYREYCLTEGITSTCILIREAERAAEEQRQKDKLDYCSFEKHRDRILLKAAYPKPDEEHTTVSEKFSFTSSASNESSPVNLQKEDGSFWKYFHPMYYFS